jgi:hypothetical protein
MARALHPYREHPVGPSGIPVSTYMRLMNAVRKGAPQDFLTRGSVQLDKAILFSQRAQQLASASADEHHWRLLLSPAALLDFDLVALFSVWLAHGRSPRAMVPDLGDRLPPMTMLPMEVAETLQRPKESPSPLSAV